MTEKGRSEKKDLTIIIICCSPPNRLPLDRHLITKLNNNNLLIPPDRQTDSVKALKRLPGAFGTLIVNYYGALTDKDILRFCLSICCVGDLFVSTGTGFRLLNFAKTINLSVFG